MNITNESEEQDLDIPTILKTRNFGLALQSLKEGYRLTRESWRNSEIYITLEKGSFYMNSFGNVVNWLPKEDELLAEDWTIVDNVESVI